MKKVYEEPSVKKVEFEFNERIAASGCSLAPDYSAGFPENPACMV